MKMFIAKIMVLLFLSTAAGAGTVVDLTDSNGNPDGQGVLCADGTVVRCIPHPEDDCSNAAYACVGHGEPRSIPESERFSMDVGIGALGDSSLKHLNPAIQIAPRWRLWGSNEYQVSLRAPLTFRPGDAAGPWHDQIDLPRFLAGPDSIAADQLQIGSSLVFTPGLERRIQLGRESSLDLFGGLGFRYDEGQTANIPDFGTARTRDSTSAVISLGMAFERRLSPQSSLRWYLQGLTSFRDEVGVELEAPSPEGNGLFISDAYSVDGGIETSVMMGLAITWRPGGRQSAPPPVPAAAARIPVYCVIRGDDCRSPGNGCLVFYPGGPGSDVRERFGAASLLEGEAIVLLGDRPKLLFELSAATEVERIPIENLVPIDPSITAALRLPGATILQGEYPIDPAFGRFGGVVFDLEVDRSPTIASPNPYAIAGRLHNRALDEVASLPSFPDVTMEESYEIAVGLLPSMENVRLPELTEILELSEEYERLGTVTADRPFDIRIIAEDWLDREQINSAQYRRFQELGDIIWKDETCSNDQELFFSEIVEFDSRLLADTSLSAEEKAPIFYASAIANHSRAYWERVEADPESIWRRKIKKREKRRCKWRWWKADIAVGAGTGLGCLAVGFGGPVSWACVVVGSTVGSLQEAGSGPTTH